MTATNIQIDSGNTIILSFEFWNNHDKTNVNKIKEDGVVSKLECLFFPENIKSFRKIFPALGGNT